MTHEERICALQSCGYTRRQAAFVCTVALHSGYFLRRQYHSFLGQKPGASAERLIRRGVANRHIHVHRSASRTLIYHLGTRSLYELLGDDDNPNQRCRQPFSIKTKLMALDFVLANPHHRFLATEGEKLEFFCRTLGLECDCLFAREYRSRNSGGPTRLRYFADQFPIFVSSTLPDTRPLVSFCYVDPARAKPSGFETYLDHYRPVFSRVPSFEVVYVATDQQMFPKAERIFARCVRVPSRHAENPLHARLREHFRIRNLFESRRSRGLDQQALDSFRNELEQYRGPEFEALYQHWKREGSTSVCIDPAREQTSRLFRPWRVTTEYQLFGELSRPTEEMRAASKWRTARTRP